MRTDFRNEREMKMKKEMVCLPSAWVGCLACRNSGSLIGKLLDGTEWDDLEAAGLTNNAGTCLKCGSDEFWVMDHENGGGVPMKYIS